MNTVGGGLLIWELSRLFPGSLHSEDQDDVYLVNVAIWMGIAAVLQASILVVPA